MPHVRAEDVGRHQDGARSMPQRHRRLVQLQQTRPALPEHPPPSAHVDGSVGPRDHPQTRDNAAVARPQVALHSPIRLLFQSHHLLAFHLSICYLLVQLVELLYEWS